MVNVSIIIPCYNHGKYLPEVLTNLESSNSIYEVIIINDGSTDAVTLQMLDAYREKDYTVVDQPNQGLSAARNTGIAHAKGEFVLLLDADNLILDGFIEKALRIFYSDSQVAVVYSDAEYFGSRQGRWNVGDFNLQRLMISNYIDACAMVRKSIFAELGGYDTEMKGGLEDWEMWLRIAFAGKKFRYIPEVGFRYRVYAQSMSGVMRRNYANRNMLARYLHHKYPDKLGHQHITNFVKGRFRTNPIRFFVKLSLLTWFNKYYRKLLAENKIIEGI